MIFRQQKASKTRQQTNKQTNVSFVFFCFRLSINTQPTVKRWRCSNAAITSRCINTARLTMTTHSRIQQQNNAKRKREKKTNCTHRDPSCCGRVYCTKTSKLSLSFGKSLRLSTKGTSYTKKIERILFFYSFSCFRVHIYIFLLLPRACHCLTL